MKLYSNYISSNLCGLEIANHLGEICIYWVFFCLSTMLTIAVSDMVWPCTDSHDSWFAVAYVLFNAILPAVSIWSRSRSRTVLFHDSYCFLCTWTLLKKYVVVCNSCCVIVLGWCTPRPPQPSSWPASWRNAPPTNTILTLSAMTWVTPINNDLGHSVSDMTGMFRVIHWLVYCLSKKKREVVLKNTFLCNFYIFMLQLFIACCFLQFDWNFGKNFWFWTFPLFKNSEDFSLGESSDTFRWYHWSIHQEYIFKNF